MSRRVRKTARADNDIQGIAYRIAGDNLNAALKWVDDLEGVFSNIAETPGMGTDRRDLRPRLRSVAFGNYIVFFKLVRNVLVIVRVIHGARDYRRIFEKK